MRCEWHVMLVATLQCHQCVVQMFAVKGVTVIEGMGFFAGHRHYWHAVCVCKLDRIVGDSVGRVRLFRAILPKSKRPSVRLHVSVYVHLIFQTHECSSLRRHTGPHECAIRPRISGDQLRMTKSIYFAPPFLTDTRVGIPDAFKPL